MLDAATYTPRLKAQYKESIRAALKEEFGYKNDMMIPKLEKIVLNIGCGRAAVKDSKKAKSRSSQIGALEPSVAPKKGRKSKYSSGRPKRRNMLKNITCPSLVFVEEHSL